MIGQLLVFYIVLTMLLIVSCYGSKFKLFHRATQIICLPILILLRIAQISPLDFQKFILNKLKWSVAVFFYSLYCLSLYSVFSHFYSSFKIRLGSISGNNLVWVEQDLVVQKQHILTLYNLFMMTNYFGSCLFFTMTIIFRNQKTSIKYQFDNIYYQPKKCQSCNTQMLARTSHCQQCNTCFQKRDHHCIWINGCIHYSNQKYFTMFLLATSVGGVCKAVIDYQFLDYVMHFTTNNLLSYIKCKELASFNIFRTIQWNLLHFPISSMSFIMHTMIAIMVGLLGLIHVKQVYDNQTSLEKRKNSAIKADLINKYALFVKDQNGNIFILNSENNAQFRNSKYIALKKQESLKLLQTYKPFKK